MAAAAKALQSCLKQPHRQQPTRLLCPWDSPGKNTGVSCQRAEHKFPFVKVFPLPPLPHTKRKRIITRSRKIAERCVCTNTNLTTVTLIFHNLPTLFTFPQFTIPGSTNVFILLLLHKFIAAFRMVSKSQILTTPLSYSALSSPMCLQFARINKTFFFLFSSCKPAFCQFNSQAQATEPNGERKDFMPYPCNSNI